MEDNKHQMAALMPRIPAFYGRNPDLWFATAESRFATAVPNAKDHQQVDEVSLSGAGAGWGHDIESQGPGRESTAGCVRSAEDQAVAVIQAHQEGGGIPDPRLSGFGWQEGNKNGWRVDELVGRRGCLPADERDISVSPTPAGENDPRGGRDVYVTSVGCPGWEAAHPGTSHFGFAISDRRSRDGPS